MNYDSFDRLDAILEASIDDLYTEGNFIENFRNKGNKDPKTKKPRPDKAIKRRIKYFRVYRKILSSSLPGLKELIQTETDKATAAGWKKLLQHWEAGLKVLDGLENKWNNVSISESYLDVEEIYANAFFNFLEAKEAESEESSSGIQSALDALDGASSGLDSAGKKKLSKIKKDLKSLLGDDAGEDDEDTSAEDTETDSDDGDADDKGSKSKSKSKKDDDDDDSEDDSDDSEGSDDEVTEAWMDDFGFDSLW